MGNSPPTPTMHNEDVFCRRVNQAAALPNTAVKGYSAVFRAVGSEFKLSTNFPEPMSSCWELVQRGVRISGNRHAIGEREKIGPKEFGEYHWITYNEFERRALILGTGMKRMNLVAERSFPEEEYIPGRKLRIVGTFSKNRTDFCVVDAAVNAFNYCLCPLYDSLLPDAITYIVNQTEMNTIFASGELAPRLFEIAKECPKLKNIVCFDEITPERKAAAEECGINLIPVQNLLDAGKDFDAACPGGLEDVQTICYTSGTTGNPKGAFITHQNWIAVCVNACLGVVKKGAVNTGIDENSVYFSFLPAAHVFERHMEYFCYYNGASMGIYCGDVTKLIEDIQTLNPTFMVVVPRIANRLHDKIFAAVAQKSKLQQLIFHKALAAKMEAVKYSAFPTHALYDKLVFNKLKAMLGNRIKCWINGGAAIDPSVQAKLRSIFCIAIATGYGMTETTGGAMMSKGDDWLMGTDGAPFQCVEMKLRSVPEMGYLVTDLPPKGELMIRGASVFNGYFRNPEETRLALTEDKWLYTGDIARVNPDGTMKIIDRAKSVFKLSQGEYVAPNHIEEVYARASLVGQVFAYGESEKDHLVGIVVPDFEVSMKWNGTNMSAEELVQDPEFKADVMAQMNQVAKDANLKGFEMVRSISLVAEPFSVENGLLTPTMKLKRHPLKQRFQASIDSLYWCD